MNAGDIIKNVKGLTHDKLTYFVRSGYVTPEKIIRGSLSYNVFTNEDLEVIQTAWGYIRRYDMKTKAAFIRAKKERADKGQLRLFK